LRELQIFVLIYQIEMAATNLLSLPPEIFNVILSALDKANIKNVCLTCRQLSDISVGHLFRRIYLSCHIYDLKIFRNIISEPRLSHHVREIIYDTSTFDKKYFLSSEGFKNDIYKLVKLRGESPTNAIHREIPIPLWIKSVHNIYDFWLQELIAHIENLQNNLDIAAFAQAMSQVPNLQSVQMTCLRYVHDVAVTPSISSPLYRKWANMREKLRDEIRQGWVLEGHDEIDCAKMIEEVDSFYDCLLPDPLDSLIYGDPAASLDFFSRFSHPECKNLARAQVLRSGKTLTSLISELSKATEQGLIQLRVLSLSYGHSEHAYYHDPDFHELQSFIFNPARYGCLLKSLRVLKLGTSSRMDSYKAQPTAGISAFLNHASSLEELVLCWPRVALSEVFYPESPLSPKLHTLILQEVLIEIDPLVGFLRRHQQQAPGRLKTLCLSRCVTRDPETWCNLVDSIRSHDGFDLQSCTFHHLSRLHWAAQCWQTPKPEDLIAYFRQGGEFPLKPVSGQDVHFP
jgi:hypothetical protein